MSMINFVLGWVERGKGFYNPRPCLCQQKYSLTKIKIIIGYPKTSSKQIIMFFARPPEKRACSDRCVVGAQKHSLGRKVNTSLALKLPSDVIVMIIKVKMTTIVGILTFMSTINVVLCWVERGKGFITSGFVWANKSIVS